MTIIPTRGGIKQHAAKLFTSFHMIWVTYSLGAYLKLGLTTYIQSHNVHRWTWTVTETTMASCRVFKLHVLTFLSQCGFQRSCNADCLNQKIFFIVLVWATFLFSSLQPLSRRSIQQNPSLKRLRQQSRDLRKVLLVICWEFRKDHKTVQQYFHKI